MGKNTMIYKTVHSKLHIEQHESRTFLLNITAERHIFSPVLHHLILTRQYIYIRTRIHKTS